MDQPNDPIIKNTDNNVNNIQKTRNNKQNNTQNKLFNHKRKKIFILSPSSGIV